MESSKFIVFSDHHRGCKDLADDFRNAEPNYQAALQQYFTDGYTLICLGDCEELWENKPKNVLENNRLTLLDEAKFLASSRYHRVYGNHDLEWKYAVPRALYMKPIFGDKFSISEGLVLRTTHKEKSYSIFLTHGHQGDQKSDGNPFSTWVVAAIWTPIQRFLEVSIDTISDSFELVDKHNIMMYEWSETQKDLIFISGHTHKPVFASMDHIDRLATQLTVAEQENKVDKVNLIKAEIERRKKEYEGKKIVRTMMKPSYFNSGCCCFNDGDITGIEIAEGFIRLIKWETIDKVAKRRVLEEAPLFYLFDHLNSDQ